MNPPVGSIESFDGTQFQKYRNIKGFRPFHLDPFSILEVSLHFHTQSMENSAADFITPSHYAMASHLHILSPTPPEPYSTKLETKIASPTNWRVTSRTNEREFRNYFLDLSLGQVPSQHLVQNTSSSNCSLCIAVLRLMPNTIAFSADNLNVLRHALLRHALLRLALSRLLLSRLLLVQVFPGHVGSGQFVTIPAYVDDVPGVIYEVQIVSVSTRLEMRYSTLGNDVVFVQRAFESAYATGALCCHGNSESRVAHYLDPLEKATCSVVLGGSGRVPNPGRPSISGLYHWLEHVEIFSEVFTRIIADYSNATKRLPSFFYPLFYLFFQQTRCISGIHSGTVNHYVIHKFGMGCSA